MYIPMITEMFKSLFSNSENWEQEQVQKINQEILDLTDSQGIDYSDPDVDFEIREDFDG